MIPSITYKNEIKDIEIGQNSTDDKITSDLMKIGLMYTSDYGFAADPSDGPQHLINIASHQLHR